MNCDDLYVVFLSCVVCYVCRHGFRPTGEQSGTNGAGDVRHGAVGGFSFEAPKFAGTESGSNFNRFSADLDTFFAFHNFNDDLRLRFLPLCLTGFARDTF